MQKEEHTRKLQRIFYGERYVGATLSKLRGISNESIERISQWHKTPDGFLVLLGPPGCGKTYFCAAMLENLPKDVHFVRCYSERNLLRKIRDSFSDNSKGDYVRYLEYLIDDDMVIIDDIGASGYTEWREEVLFAAIDYRYSLRKPSIFTSNLTKEELGTTYSPRLRSRLLAKENIVLDLSGCGDLRQEGL